MSTKNEYLERVQAVVTSVGDRLTQPERQEVEHLIEHDEIGEALRALAWIIVEEDKYVSAEAVIAIRELSAGLVPVDDLPPDLDRHAVRDD